MNILTIFQEGAAAIGLLAAAGVPIPAPLTNTVAKALPVVTAVSNIAANPPSNASAVISDIATVASTIPTASTGVSGADTAIANILKELETFSTWQANVNSGQAAVDFTTSYSVNGVAKKLITVSFLEGGPAAASFGF